MKKIALMICLLVVTVAAQAQFEKGKWFVSPSLTGLDFSRDTEADRFSFGLQAQAGAFLVDNFALLVNAGANLNVLGSEMDYYNAGVGCRYYFSKVGIYLGTNVGMDCYKLGEYDDTKLAFGMEAGYAFFLSRTVTIEPAAYWNVNDDRSKFGVRVGFGFYF